MNKIYEMLLTSFIGKVLKKENRPDSIVGGALAGAGVATIVEGGIPSTWEEALVLALYGLFSAAFLYYKTEGLK